MVKLTTRTLGLVLSAIHNLREIKGSTNREIFHYITSVSNITPDVAHRQMQTALKRGVAYGILRKNGRHYSILPMNTKNGLTEVAAQELGLLDLCARRRRSRKGCKRPRRARRGKKAGCRCTRSRRSRMKRQKCGSSMGKKRRKRRRSCIGKRVLAGLSKRVPRQRLMKARLTQRRADPRHTKYADTEPLFEVERFSRDRHSSRSSTRPPPPLPQRKKSDMSLWPPLQFL